MRPQYEGDGTNSHYLCWHDEKNQIKLEDNDLESTFETVMQSENKIILSYLDRNKIFYSDYILKCECLISFDDST